MKKLIMAVTMALACTLVAQNKSISLAEARGKITEVKNTPAKMTELMQQLSDEDQVAFLAEVNAAISDMPGSTDEKTAMFLDVNSAALKGAKPGNLTSLLAEVFATVPPAALTVINEQFASGLFNRSADPSKTYTDAEYADIAKKVLDKVQQRNATADNAGVRNTFAILMLLRASNNPSSTELRDTLVNELKDKDTQDLAQKEWISPALGIGQAKTYDPMLGAADAGSAPDPEVVIDLAHVQAMDALLGDLASGSGVTASDSFVASLSPLFHDPYTGLDRRPRTTDPSSKVNPSYKRGETPSEPRGYEGQFEY